MTTDTIQRKTMNGKPVYEVPSKTVINFESGFQKKQLCDGPTFTAGTACPYSCAFCYVPDAMRKQTPWLASKGVAGRHEEIVIRRAGAVQTMRDQLTSHSLAERSKLKVIYASPLTDVAANLTLVSETVDMCKVILSHTNWDIRLLSKSNLLPEVAQMLEVESPVGQWANPESRHVWETPREMNDWKYRVIYGVSTGTLNEAHARAIEGDTPLVSKRIESLHWLQDNGFRTFGMICPSLPQSSYESFAEGMALAIRVEKCEHVWAEVINLRGESFTRTHAALKSVDEAAADKLWNVINNKDEWEAYAVNTFNAHRLFIPESKLRFLQYWSRNPRWKERWTHYDGKGAVML